MTAKENLALALSELIKRLSSEEKLMRHISWKELEEWKATQERPSDTELMANLKKGFADEKKGLVTEVNI